MALSNYHPAYDTGDAYLSAAQHETDPAKKLILERAAASVAYLRKHMIGTQNLLARMNNVIVEAVEGEEFFDQDDMEPFLPEMRAAIEAVDDEKNMFSTPFESWKHLSTNDRPYPPSDDEIEIMISESLIDLDVRLTKLREKPMTLMWICVFLLKVMGLRKLRGARFDLVNRHLSSIKFDSSEERNAEANCE